ncbi:MAG: glycosyl hydrolase-related protein, partial [Treponema sp.]|nr:glycosyl hydrolase-related protein [Treponema sp.]
EGDGGGGTLRSDLEMARRFGNLEGAPRAAWKKVSAALDSIFTGAGDLPEWRGELYLELHRGTYTTQARTKRNNRRLEFALRSTEFLSAFAALDGKTAYPGETLLESWKKTLTLQFHDIIPGSSIGRVYEEAEEDAEKILHTLENIRGEVCRRLLEEHGGGLLAVNDLSWTRRDALRVPASWTAGGNIVRASEGTEYPIQRYVNMEGEEEAVFAPALPPMGWDCFRISAGNGGGGGKKPPFKWQENLLETPFYRIAFDRAGRITSFVDLKQDRELVAPGGFFNSIITAEDVPVFWDAWDIDADWTRHIAEDTNLVSTETAASGPVCFRLRKIYRIGTASKLTQDMVCYAENPRIDFETKAEWKERRRLLKAEFDTVIDAAQVRCEVQYGHLFRNTHRNLPQDRAKFEICAHKWISLEETGGGIALLNDCKYGYDVSGGVMRISLLRSPMAPDMEADQGAHRFTYALLPFGGSFEEGGIIRSAYELNVKAAAEYAPPSGSGEAAARSLCSLDGEGVIIESVKAPERGDGNALVVRLYESLGGHRRAALRLDRPAAAVYQTDMLEEHGEALPFNGSEVPLDFRPFEIKTLLVSFHA